jgi:hypothetical protein
VVYHNFFTDLSEFWKGLNPLTGLRLSSIKRRRIAMKVDINVRAADTLINLYKGRQFSRLIASLLVMLLIYLPALAEKHAKGAILDFAVTPVIDVGEAPVDVAVMDLDGDRNLDLIVANALSQNLSIFTRNDTGQFYLRYTIEGLFGRLLTGDFNSDGKSDLILAGKDFVEPIISQKSKR